MLVLGFQANHLAEWLEELVGRVDDEVEIELLDDICFLLRDLSSSVLVSAAGDQLLHLRHLVGLLKLGSHVECCHSHQLQLTQRHLLHRQVLVDQRGYGEQRLWEHLVLVVELTEPVEELGPRLLRNGGMGGDIVVKFVGLLFATLEEVQVFGEVFRHHLWISDFEFDFRRFLLNLSLVVEASSDITMLVVE